MKTKLLRKLRHKFLKNYTLRMFGKNIVVQYRGYTLTIFPFETNIEEINDFIRQSIHDDIERYCRYERRKNKQKVTNKVPYLW